MSMRAAEIQTDIRVEVDVNVDQEIACECMVCDLPLGSTHEPVEWRVALHFPGPYPLPGDVVMLLCDHCRDDWVGGEWEPPYNNFQVVGCVKV